MGHRAKKFTDRCSVVVVMTSKELMADVRLHNMTGPVFFGQFGIIESLPALTSGHEGREVYIRFTDEAAGIRCLEWCRSQPLRGIFESAQFGYSKYCVDFLNGKKCQQSDCHNRHARTPGAPHAKAQTAELAELDRMRIENLRLEAENASQSSHIQWLTNELESLLTHIAEH